MPYTLNWYIEDEIVYVRYSGDMTTDDFRASLLQIIKMIDTSPRTLVHIITDVGDVVKSLSIGEAMPVLRETGSHARAGWSITIREKSVLVKLAASMGSSLFRMRFRNFSSLDQAVIFLKQTDKTLNWDKVREPLTQAQAESAH
ncbi:MAG TPA: hypothetical protein VHL11_17860 [Phototrophicaceae bacterium]|jgi:hypothetical protein|nr:hypothetical protein [Phototrophicaceae bacterium]